MFSLGDKIEFFIGSPFSTPVGQRIERATNALLSSEDWGLNMEICDIINETDDGPRDAVKALKKRIVDNKNFREIMLSLTVLETCVKNCGHRFHVLVASQDFVEGVLVRSILPKYNPPTALHERVLSLIQSWADAFRSSSSLSGVVSVYEDLRRRGLEFPMTDLDALSPIHTPHRSIPESDSAETAPATTVPSLQYQQPQQQAPPPPPAPTQGTLSLVEPSDEGPVSITTEQEQKLRGDLVLVKCNLTVMTDMLNQLTPAGSQQDDRELLQQLYSVCKSMQSRVVELIPRLLDERLIAELLVVNDDLNNTFIRYERFERLAKAQSTATEQDPVSSPQLIDLTPSLQTVSQPAVISTTNQPTVSAPANQRQDAKDGVAEEEEFDMFAQTRSSSLAEQRKSVRYEDPGAVEGLAEALDTRLQVTGAMPPTSTLDEIDRWLSSDMQDEQSAVSEGVSSEDFDRFLDDRANIADYSSRTPPAAPPALSSRPPPTQSTRKQEKSHDQLFSL